MQAREMRHRLQQIQLALLVVPVRTHPLETTRAVAEGMGHEPEADVAVADVIAVLEDPVAVVLGLRAVCYGRWRGSFGCSIRHVQISSSTRAAARRLGDGRVCPRVSPGGTAEDA